MKGKIKKFKRRSQPIFVIRVYDKILNLKLINKIMYI